MSPGTPGLSECLPRRGERKCCDASTPLATRKTSWSVKSSQPTISASSSPPPAARCTPGICASPFARQRRLPDNLVAAVHLTRSQISDWYFPHQEQLVPPLPRHASVPRQGHG